MIFVTLGTQRFQMNRLLEAVDQMALNLQEEIFIQSGHSTYVPRNCEYRDFVDAEEFQGMIENCSVLITHSGVGTIMRGLNAGKPVVVVPRLARFHEHVDDHQVQIAEAFAGKNCVLYCQDVDRLQETVEKARNYPFKPYKAPESKIEDLILDYLQGLEADTGRRKNEQAAD